MLKRYYSIISPALRVLDVFILTGCWLLAYFLRENYPLPMMRQAMPPLSDYLGYTIVIALLWGAVFSVENLYKSKRLTRRTVEAYKVLRAHSISTLLFISLTYLVTSYKLSRGVFVYFYFSSAFFLVAYRLTLRNTIRRLRTRGYSKQNVLVVGTGPAAIETCRRLLHHPELGLEILGLVGERADSVGKDVGGFKVIGTVEGLRGLVQDKRVGRVVVALGRKEGDLLEGVLNALKDEMVDMVLVPDIYDFVAIGCEIEDFDGLPMVSLNETPIVGANLALKRVSDIFLSIVAIVLTGPLMLLLSLIIKITSRGPVFYRQERMSLNGRKFHILKFRSMSADPRGNPQKLTVKDDPRVTEVGRFIRRTSLDELPQFFNVLRGDMSIVGPRPEQPWVVDKVRDQIPRYMLKHKVKAGITGWAQVNGWRGDTSFEKRIEFDLYYIKNWSLLFDFKILVLTVFKGLVNKNAY